VLNKKLSLAINIIAKDNFQNQAYLDYITFDSYLNKTITFDLVTNTITDKIFNIVCNLVYPDSIPCDSYFNRPIAFDTVANGIITSTNFDVILSQVCLCNSYFNQPITLNTKANNRVFPEYTVYNFDNNKLLTLNLATSTVADNTFDIQNLIFLNPDKLLTLNLVTSIVANNIFDI
jgi:hypothetical protein